MMLTTRLSSGQKAAAISSSVQLARASRTQRGVVLIVALLMLVVISIVASLSVRNATSSEVGSGATRTTQLAMQAAEIALRYCENSVVQIISPPSNPADNFVTTLTTSNIQAYSTTPKWQSTTIWDGTSGAVYVLPTATVNGSGVSTTYARMPECIIENLPEANATGSTATTRTYVITARGFGPEVAAVNATRTRPTGTEVWLQTTIEF